MDAKYRLERLKVHAVWDKGKTVPGCNPSEYRMDNYGKVIKKSDYGQKGEYGWKIDHISQGSKDSVNNLQPLHWLNNSTKSDDVL